MKPRNFVLALLAAGLFASSAHASIIYSIDRTVGTGTVKGTITTDGTLGDLTLTSILDWSITISDAVGSYLLNYANSDFYPSKPLTPNIYGIGLTATSESLLFDFSDGGFSHLQLMEAGDGGPFWSLGDRGQSSTEITYAGPALYEVGGTKEDYEEVYFSRYSSAERNGEIIVGIADYELVEPATAALLALGLAGIVGSRKLKHA